MSESSISDPSFAQAGPIALAVKRWGERLRISLDDARTSLRQSGNRGDANEGAVRDFLRAHLPPTYRVGQGEVIDHAGRQSRQMDVVVADEEQPFQVDDTPRLMIIEGVSAAAEVKTTLTTNELRDCLEKGRRFKALEAILGKSVTLAPLEQRGKPNSDLQRFYQHRPFFAFAYEGAIDNGTLIEILSEEERSRERGAVPALDAVFILDRGFAMNVWDGNGALTFYSSGEIMTGWHWFGDPDRTLLGLLFWLHGAMPRFMIRSSPLLAYLLPRTIWTPDPPQGHDPLTPGT